MQKCTVKPTGHPTGAWGHLSGAPGAAGFAALSPRLGRPCGGNLMYYPESVSRSGVRFEKLPDCAKLISCLKRLKRCVGNGKATQFASKDT